MLVSGAVLTVLLASATGLYGLLTWQEPGRGVMMVFALAALVDGALVWMCAEALLRSRRKAHLLAAWAISHVAAIVLVALADGGVDSPTIVLLFVVVAYASAWYPPGALLVVGAAAALGAVAIDVFDDEPASRLAIFFEICVVCAAAVAALTARERAATIELLRSSQEEVITRLSRALEWRDPTTGSHIDRMSGLCAEVGAALGMHADRCGVLRMAASMHDVGKIAVPDAILDKPGPLTPEERAIMQRHAEIGRDLLAGSDSEILRLAADIAHTHHERWDGTGYPRGIAGEEIPLEGRIAAVCDVFDALTSDRPYRPAMPAGDALALVGGGAGTQFDAAVVRALDAVLEAARPPATAAQRVAMSTPWPGANRSPA